MYDETLGRIVLPLSHEERHYLRREISIENKSALRTRPTLPDPEAEGRAAFAAAGLPWPGDMPVAA